MKKLGALLLVLSLILGLNVQSVFATEITSLDQEITSYLEEASTIRGFEVTEENVNEALAGFGLTKVDFTTLAEIESVLGEVIKADFSNLENIYSDYELDQTGLNELLGEYGEELSDYVFLNDLDMDLYFYTNSSDLEDTGSSNGAFPEFDEAMMLQMIDQLGLSEDELTKVQEHYVSIMDELSSAEVVAQLEDLNNRMMVLAESINAKISEDPTYQPSEAELSELGTLYDEMLSVYQIKLEISIVKDGVETTLNLAELMQLSDLKDADLKVLLYNSNSELLADAIIPSELINTELENIIGDNDASENDTVETEKGGELPKTAANYSSNAVIGMLVALAGILVYRKVRFDKGENLEK